jgi:pyruvate dehydrogenase E1 component alpha subunit
VALALRGCSAERLVDPRAGARPYKLAPNSGAPGNRALHAVGLALAGRQPVLCLLGDASGANGAFYEALNLASLTRAPVVFVLLEHGLGAGAPVGPQRAGEALALAGALGLSARAAAPELEALREAVSAAMALGAPALIHSRLPR